MISAILTIIAIVALVAILLGGILIAEGANAFMALADEGDWR